MVYPISKSLQYLSLLYLFVVLLEAISWPLARVFFFENLLFIPSFFVACYIVLKNKGTFLMVSVIAFCVFISLLIIEIASSREFIFDHLLYLMRWIKYAVVFILAQYFYHLCNFHQTNKLIKSVFLIVVGINLLVLINPWQIGQYIQNLHAPKDFFHLSNFYEPGVFRLGGTFMNPNDNGVFFSLFFLFFALHRSLKDYYFSILALLMVVFSQSRTAMLLCLGISAIWIVYYLLYSKVTRKQWLSALSVSILMLVCFMFFNLGYLGDLFNGQAFRSNSFVSRIENFSRVYNSTDTDFYFGQGIIHNQVEIFGYYLDSEIALVLAQFGLVGWLVWLFFVVSMFFISKGQEVESKVFASLLLFFVGVSFTNLSFFNAQLSLILFALLGVSFSRNNKIESNTDKETQNNPF
jgi:hypothetical protein